MLGRAGQVQPEAEKSLPCLLKLWSTQVLFLGPVNLLKLNTKCGVYLCAVFWKKHLWPSSIDCQRDCDLESIKKTAMRTLNPKPHVNFFTEKADL